jgi:NDP-sugar pyrophosphorylase family protein
MKAMLLSAGFGVRMRPLTYTLPKPAIPVLGRPIAAQILHRMACNGVTEAVVNLHHLAGVVRSMLGSGADSGLPPIRFSFEETILGTGGGVRKAAPLLRGAGPILLNNCDFLCDIDLRTVLGEHRRSGLRATLVLAPPRAGYSIVEVDGTGRVLSLGGRPEADPGQVAGSYLFTGCHVIDESLLERLPENRPSNIVLDLYRPLAAEGLLGSVVHEGFWWEFGSPALYLEGSLGLFDLASETRRQILDHDPVQELDGGLAAVGTGAKMHTTAELRGRAALGFASYISERVRLVDSVVMPEAWIGPGCRVERSIVAPGVEVPSSLEIEEMVVCADPGPDTSLPAGSRRDNGLLFSPLRAEQDRS